MKIELKQFLNITSHSKSEMDSFSLPYEGAFTIQLPQEEWIAHRFTFTYTCYHPKREFWGGMAWYPESRSAFVAERKDGGQMFFYAAVPDNIFTFSDYNGYVSENNITELRSEIERFKNVHFSGDPRAMSGSCFHDRLGEGSWKADLYKANGTWHILLSISFQGMDNETFFQTAQKEYLVS